MWSNQDALRSKTVQLDPIITPFYPHNFAARGALIVIFGGEKSGKTNIAENIVENMIHSFCNTAQTHRSQHSNLKYPPIYVGTRPRAAAEYFGDLFCKYECPYSGEKTVSSMCNIWQQGCAEQIHSEHKPRQGDVYMAERENAFHGSHLLLCRHNVRPRLALYMDHCDDNIDFVQKALEPMIGQYEANKITTVVEISRRTALQRLASDILVVTSHIDNLDLDVLSVKLQLTPKIANDLQLTCNSFIVPGSVCLVVDLVVWQRTNQKQGLHIMEYGPVPPLLELRDQEVDRLTTEANKKRIAQIEHQKKQQEHHSDTDPKLVDAFEQMMPLSVSPTCSVGDFFSCPTSPSVLSRCASGHDYGATTPRTKISRKTFDDAESKKKFATELAQTLAASKLHSLSADDTQQSEQKHCGQNASRNRRRTHQQRHSAPFMAPISPQSDKDAVAQSKQSHKSAPKSCPTSRRSSRARHRSSETNNIFIDVDVQQPESRKGSKNRFKRKHRKTDVVAHTDRHWFD